MSKNIKTQLGNITVQSINAYAKKLKPTVDEIKFKEQYRGRIVDCMIGEVDDNYIQTPPTDSPIVKLENSRKGLVKLNSIKGKTVLVDAEGNVTDTPAEGCRLVSVGEEESNKLIFLSKNKNLADLNKITSYSKCSLISKNNEEGTITVSYNGNYTNFAISLNDILDKVRGKSFRASYSDVINSNSDATLSIQLNGRYKNGKNFYLYPSYNFITITDDMETLNFAIFQNNTSANLQGTFTIKNLQLEISETKSTFENAKSHKTEILLDEPLVKGNCIDDNKYIIKYKKITFNGSESWGDFEIKDDTIKVFLGSHYDELVNVKSVKDAMNNYDIAYGYNGSDYEHFYMDANFALFLNKARGINTLQEFKDYLSKNNLELIAELKEPIIKELPTGFTLQGFDDTTIYIENKVTPTVTYEYDAIIPLKENIAKQREEVEINTLDVNNNIIPYLMDMEFNLMLMEDN